jgi:hypothetical protein
MKDKSQGFLLSVFLGGVLLLVVLLSSIAHNKDREGGSTPQQQTNSITTVRSGPFKYLPEGARIDDESKDVVFADIDGDGQKEQIIFYSITHPPNGRKAGILVLKAAAADYARFWERTYDDSGGFADPTGVYKLSNGGKMQIVAYRTIGASCPGALDIFESRAGKIQQITGPWAGKGECHIVEISDINHDGNKELILRTRDGGGLRTDIYVWNGSKYLEGNKQFSQYYSSELGALVTNIRSVGSAPISARIAWCSQAVRIYLIQGRYPEALHLAEDGLIMIDNPTLTKPNSLVVEGGPPDQAERIAAFFEIEKAEGKATLHRLLGDIYRAAGESQRARKEYDEMQKLQASASELKASRRY